MSTKIRKSLTGFCELSVSNQRWSDALTQRYLDESCEAVSLGALDKEFFYPNLDFLRDLPHLREVRLLGDVRDDRALAELTTLEVLKIDTGWKKPLDLAELRRLRWLVAPWPHRISGIDALTRLELLEVFGFAGDSLEWIGPKPHLRFLRLDARRRHTYRLTGIENCPHVRKLWLYGGVISDTTLLAAVAALREIELAGVKITELNFAGCLPALVDLVLESCGSVATVEPLRSHPTLQGLAISGSTVVADGDLSPLLTIPNLVRARIASHRTYRLAANEINNRFPSVAGELPWVTDPVYLT